MRILVSGAAGFLGSHLTDLILAEGHDVIGVDNFITGRQANLAHLQNNGRFKLVQYDVTNPMNVDGPIDRIYHLASPASPAAYAAHRIATMTVNSRGTANLLDLALEKNARLLITSTSEIYGDPDRSPLREDYWGHVNPIGLRSVYEEAKRFSEAIVMAYHRERNADTRIVRIFNTYGPRMRPDDGRVVTNFVRQALSNESITVAGDGTQSRSFCYCLDTLHGVIGAMEADFHEPINLGHPEETTILQLARDILSLVPESKSKINFEPRSDYDPRGRCPDLMRARQILGWAPRVPRLEGLAKVVDYHRQMMRIEPGDK
jgi:nucleoside-diphosphate-sugar epimerase